MESARRSIGWRIIDCHGEVNAGDRHAGARVPINVSITLGLVRQK